MNTFLGEDWKEMIRLFFSFSIIETFELSKLMHVLLYIFMQTGHPDGYVIYLLVFFFSCHCIIKVYFQNWDFC